ncbi:wax ester/triacylglycerol synthase family O-acyltransferase [Conexibacter sp. JD483]|uniref:WS/DGAT/MGAT family O-acyltransferase n=1 Tax=unclassified Conexibacter TaxID=2627773 RepID=UPI00271DD229|nr:MULTISPECIES: wax ester/triacylglycerol synthase family O-acyltransferase [unclassified Conexibacter]MDO8188046.1 wax ester/triacylglycerol synthase family O-acyltransferase [Conexibacter sp. CPCC 205706]MDO8200468.1 wax ester/triacylglycerol synthase family O-acyltransferase [Conexibacter sp. CPCC 205762]MDR9369815.1 wax ester/triacylglycerol synthase family O-acyltransferase [Conexibacter sp. JD483]
MAQEHLDRLTAVDASFLHQEDAASHMHIGAVTIFEGPPPPFAAVLDHIRGRLQFVPRYRQKLAYPPLDSGRPLWVDDPTFNLEYHVRHSALPAPGSEQQLYRLAARIGSQQLDRSKPLWECWFVEGLEDNRFALIFKTHHALVDGVSGVDLATVLFDLQPVPPRLDPEATPWQPKPEPTSAEMVAAGVAGLVKTGIDIASKALAAATNPSGAVEALREASEGIGEIVWAGLNPAPDTPLNVPIGPHRRYAIVRNELADFRYVKGAFNATVNDVVLALISGALGRWLRSRGMRTEGLELRALVPVSIRAEGQRHQLGNQIVLMRGPLPVYIKDPVARLRFVKEAMDGLKESKQAVGARVLADVQQLAPPTVLAQASRIQFSTRLFNLLTTNVPGPQFPLYVLGRELQDLFPVAFLPKNHSLAIAIMSYNGRVNFGLLGDYDNLPDIDVIADGIADGLAELKRAAQAKEARAAGARATVSAASSAPAPAPARAPSANGTAPARAERAPRRRRAAAARTRRAPARRSREPVATVSAPSENGTAEPQLLPRGPVSRTDGPGAAMRARRRPSSRNGSGRGS